MLHSLRNYLDSNSRIKIFRGMVLPCVTYSCTVSLDFNQTQRRKLQSIDRLVAKISGTKQTLVENEIKKHSILLVRKCIKQKTCSNFQNYFQIASHERVTRNNGSLITIPMTNLKYAKKGFFCMGASHYNALPIETRKIENFRNFREQVYNIYG